MTPQEKLKEIKDKDVIGLDNLFWQEYRWLIARVEQLEGALTEISKDVYELNPWTVGESNMAKIASKALHTGPKPE